MGHIRLGILPRSKKWWDVVALLDGEASAEAIVGMAATASNRDLSEAPDDPRFQFVANLLVTLPLAARSPGFMEQMQALGIAPADPGCSRE